MDIKINNCFYDCIFYKVPEMRFTDDDKDWCDHPMLKYDEQEYVVKDVNYNNRNIPELCPLRFEDVTIKL